MIEHALRFVDRVVFVVGENNLRSQRALLKIGATPLRRAQLPAGDGTGPAKLVFSITRRPRP